MFVKNIQKAGENLGERVPSLAQLGPGLAKMRETQRHQIPEFARVIHLAKVAELVHNDVVAEMLRQQRDFIIKIKVAARRTTPPSAFLILYENAPHRKLIFRPRIPLGYFALYEHSSRFLIGLVMRA